MRELRQRTIDLLLGCRRHHCRYNYVLVDGYFHSALVSRVDVCYNLYESFDGRFALMNIYYL